MSLRVFAISDTHNHSLPRILEGCTGDLLLIAGDWSYKATIQEIRNFKADLKAIRTQFKSVVWINGNHEIGMEYNLNASYDLAQETDTIHLHNEKVTLAIPRTGAEHVLEGVKIWGSPATPYFGGWAYNYQRGHEIAQIWRDIPEGLDILMTHGPALRVGGILPWSGEDVGCEELRGRLDNLKAPPRVHVSGHLHCNSSGGIPTRWTTKRGRFIEHYNVSICNERYDPANAPTEFYL